MSKVSAKKQPENIVEKRQAIAYLRTSSATNVMGDSSTRQREAISGYAARADIDVIAEFYDAAVSGADSLDARPGFADLLAFAQANGSRLIIVENASRFARDLIVQETGHGMLKNRGIELIASDDPDAFTADTPTAIMVRQILGAVAQFEKAATVAKLKGARDRASTAKGRRVEGRKGYAETNHALVKAAKRLARASPLNGERRSLRQISDALAKEGFLTKKGTQFAAGQVNSLVKCKIRDA